MCHVHNGQEAGTGDALTRPFHFPVPAGQPA